MVYGSKSSATDKAGMMVGLASLPPQSSELPCCSSLTAVVPAELVPLKHVSWTLEMCDFAMGATKTVGVWPPQMLPENVESGRCQQGQH